MRDHVLELRQLSVQGEPETATDAHDSARPAQEEENAGVGPGPRTGEVGGAGPGGAAIHTDSLTLVAVPA